MDKVIIPDFNLTIDDTPVTRQLVQVITKLADSVNKLSAEVARMDK